MDKKTVTNFGSMLGAYELVEQVLDNKFLQNQENKDIYLGAKREAFAIAFQIKEAIVKMTESQKIEGGEESLFNLLKYERILNAISFSDVLDFFAIFVRVQKYDYFVDNILMTSAYKKQLEHRAYSKEFAKLMVEIIDANINETYAGRHILKDWMLHHFKDRTDILAVMAARLKFLEESGAANIRVWETRDIIDTYKPFINNVYGLLNPEEEKALVQREWVEKEDLD